MEPRDAFLLVRFIYDISGDYIAPALCLAQRFRHIIAGVFLIDNSYAIVIPRDGRQEECRELCLRNNLRPVANRLARKRLQNLPAERLREAIALLQAQKNPHSG